MPINPDGTYTITNKKTGEKKTIKANELSKYGISAPKLSNEGSIESAIGSTGIFDTPVVGGLIRAATHPLIKGGEMVAEGIKSGSELAGSNDFVKSLTQDPIGTLTASPEAVSRVKDLGQQNRTFQSEQAFQNTQDNPIAEGLKTGAATAAYALPGAGIVGGTSVRGLAGAGAMSGFGESEASDLPGLATDTVLGAALAPVLGKFAPEGAGKLAKQLPKTFFDRMPKALRANLAKTERKLDSLSQSKLSSMVGYKNLDKAREWGIDANDMPEDVLAKVQPHMDALGEELNQVLSGEGATTNLLEVKEAIMKAQRETTPGLNGVDLTSATHQWDDFLRQNISDQLPTSPITGEELAGGVPRNSAGTAPIMTNRELAGGNAIPMTPDQMDTAPIPLSVVNKIKLRMGERYNDDPIFKNAYHNLQEMIERKSGSPEIVKGINQEYNTLRDIKNNAQKAVEKPNKYITDYDIKKSQIEDAPLVDPKFGLAASGLALGAAPVVGPVVGTMGGLYMTYRILNHILRDPKAAQKILGGLEKPGKLLETGAGQKVSKAGKISKNVVSKALEQAGIRSTDSVGNTLFGE